MVLKLYVDLLSQPARALTLFVKKNNIPHELKIVSILKGEHKAPDYVQNIHRFGKIPAIDDDGFKMIESIAIFRYLARKYNVPDHWYPTDLQKQAKVDEFLEWHHLGERAPLGLYFLTVYLKPLLSGKPPEEGQISQRKKTMEEALDLIENVWLKENPYITGNQITIADLVGISEIEQPRLAKYDVTAGRPKIRAWMERVQSDLQPHYNEVFKTFNKILENDNSKL